MLHVLGVTREHLGIPETTADANAAYPITIPSTSTSLPSLHTLFSHACPSRAPGDQYRLHSVLHEFLTTPLLAEERTKLKKERTNKRERDLVPQASPSSDFRRGSEQKGTANINDFLLTPSEMVSHNYRLPSYVELPAAAEDPQDTSNGWTRTPPAGLPESWVETQVPLIDLQGNAAKQKIWAMDCEMVGTLSLFFCSTSSDEFHSRSRPPPGGSSAGSPSSTTPLPSSCSTSSSSPPTPSRPTSPLTPAFPKTSSPKPPSHYRRCNPSSPPRV